MRHNLLRRLGQRCPFRRDGFRIRKAVLPVRLIAGFSHTESHAQYATYYDVTYRGLPRSVLGERAPGL